MWLELAALITVSTLHLTGFYLITERQKELLSVELHGVEDRSRRVIRANRQNGFVGTRP